MRDYFKELHGKSKKDWKKANRIPKTSDSLDRLWKRAKSNYDIRVLGIADGEVTITEEQRRTGIHILGAPDTGKSKFLEYHIRRDIDLGNGLLLLDPGEGGDTVRNVLDYCAQVGYEKVILIDPAINQKYDRIPKLAPLKSDPRYRQLSIDGILGALEILFQADLHTTRKMRRNFSALLGVLARKQLTVRELVYFSEYGRDKGLRAEILDGDDRDTSIVKSLFRNEFKFDKDFSSTVNFAHDLWKYPLAAMLGNKEGIDFVKAIRDKYVVLVNLSTYKLTPDQSTLLGVIIISEVFQAITRLFNNHWKGRFYLYVDEAGRFATPQFSELLNFRRKSGLGITIAHHDFAQFKNQQLLRAILNASKIKMMFDTPGYEDRVQMIKELGYGGDVTPLMAAYANKDIARQHAVVRNGHEPPIRVRIPDVVPVPKASEEYISKILNHPFYKSKNDRTPRIIQEDSPRSKRGAVSNQKAARADSVSRRRTPSILESLKKSRPDANGPAGDS